MIQTDTGNKTTLRNYEIALIQMDTQNDKGENMKKACRFIDEAAAHGSRLICFPEVMNLIGRNVGEGGGKEELPGYTSELLCRKAKEHRVWIHGGSITEQVLGQKKSRNLSLLINPDGEIAAQYRKLHMFDITLADGTPFRESDRVEGGNEITTVSTELGTFGMSICYDIRFPELYRLMALQGGPGNVRTGQLYHAYGKGSLGAASAGQSDREWLLYCGGRSDWHKTGLRGLWKQHGSRPLGNDYSQGQRYGVYHLRPDRPGLSGSDTGTAAVSGEPENRCV